MIIHKIIKNGLDVLKGNLLQNGILHLIIRLSQSSEITSLCKRNTEQDM